jgi:hypothetical protein
VLEGDVKTLAATGERGLVELLVATHTGMTTDEFAQTAADWLATVVDMKRDWKVIYPFQR